MTVDDAKLIERLEVLRWKLDDEGRYASRNTVALAIERIDAEQYALASDEPCDHLRRIMNAQAPSLNLRARVAPQPSLWLRVKAFAYDPAARLAPIAWRFA